ncbi:MAG: glycosyltransferase family 2 protein [Candidatus Puniceispirillaceae bacterium]
MGKPLTNQDKRQSLSQKTVPLLSLIVPVFNEAESVGVFVQTVNDIFDDIKSLRLEILFINDGSHDDTLDRLLALQKTNKHIRIVDLSRNFGKEAALTAGLVACKGDLVVPIDVDLQEPPEVILEMLEKWHEGYEVVLAKRVDRSSDTWLKRTSANLFYRIHNKIADPAIPENVGDFRLMDRKVVDALNQLPETKRFMKGLFAWIGFRTAIVEFERQGRAEGKTKFNGLRLFGLAIDGLTSFSVAPLRLWSYLGCLIAMTSFLFVMTILVRFFVFGVDVPGYASLIVAITFLGGLQLIGIGVLGEYLGRVFVESKRRPVFIVRHTYEDE